MWRRALRGILNIDVGQETGIIVFVFTARALDAMPAFAGRHARVINKTSSNA